MRFIGTDIVDSLIIDRSPGSSVARSNIWIAPALRGVWLLRNADCFKTTIIRSSTDLVRMRCEFANQFEFLLSFSKKSNFGGECGGGGYNFSICDVRDWKIQIGDRLLPASEQPSSMISDPISLIPSLF